jgi:hypothetical protein
MEALAHEQRGGSREAAGELDENSGGGGLLSSAITSP